MESVFDYVSRVTDDDDEEKLDNSLVDIIVGDIKKSIKTDKENKCKKRITNSELLERLEKLEHRVYSDADPFEYSLEDAYETLEERVDKLDKYINDNEKPEFNLNNSDFNSVSNNIKLPIVCPHAGFESVKNSVKIVDHIYNINCTDVYIINFKYTSASEYLGMVKCDDILHDILPYTVEIHCSASIPNIRRLDIDIARVCARSVSHFITSHLLTEYKKENYSIPQLIIFRRADFKTDREMYKVIGMFIYELSNVIETQAYSLLTDIDKVPHIDICILSDSVDTLYDVLKEMQK